MAIAQVIKETFAEVYEIDLADEVASYMVGAPCPDTSWSPMLYDCASPEVAWSAGVHVNDTMDCVGDDVIGGYTSEGGFPSVRSFTFSAPEPGSYYVRLASDGDVAMQIGSCFSCPWERDVGIFRSGKNPIVDLAAGRYYVRIAGDSAEATEYAIDIVRAYVTP